MDSEFIVRLKLQPYEVKIKRADDQKRF